MFEHIPKILERLQQERPLILNLTNSVTMDFVANGLLSIGASPLMSQEAKESIDLLTAALSVVINIGTLNRAFISHCKQVCHVANQFHKPVIFDPVGVGASSYRTQMSLMLLRDYRLSIVRGNASEILALADSRERIHSKGVDSVIRTEEALEAGKQLSQQYPMTVVITGETDVIISGEKEYSCHHGSIWMRRVTGSGCLLSAVIGAFHAVESCSFIASCAAVLFYGLCAERAAQQALGPASFKVAFLDALYAGIQNKKQRNHCVLTIAGTDPSGGAGIQADIKAITATGGYAASVITALVAQNTQGVQAIEAVSPAFITQQMHSVFSDLSIKAVKIGMLHSEQVIAVVVRMLQSLSLPAIVLDPVMVAQDGSLLLSLNMIDCLKKQLLSMATLITPNLFEAEQLTQQKIENHADMLTVAFGIGEQFKVNVLLKGGHLRTESARDVLYLFKEKACHWFEAPYVDTRNTHGTGCSLSSAIASYLAQGHSLKTAVAMAKQYLTAAIQSGSRWNIGQGAGPVDHFYYL